MRRPSTVAPRKLNRKCGRWEKGWAVMGFNEIGAEIGVSGQRVQQIVATALLKLRAEIKRRGFTVEDLRPLPMPEGFWQEIMREGEEGEI